MRRRVQIPVQALIACLLFTALAATACGSEESGDANAAAAGTTPAGAVSASAGTTLALGKSQFGQVLFDSKKQAIYMFDRETTRKPRCYGACAKAWPPVYANGRPRVAAGLKPNLLGTTRRRDGRKQVTYGGHPLYFYAHEGPGQVLCHNIVEYGGLWLAMRGNGKPVPEDA